MTELTSSIEKITPAQAELWLEKNFERQRPLRQWQVNFLAEQMEKGRFQPTAQIGIAHANGQTCIVNGQHTLWAIVESGQTQVLPVVRHIVDTEAELNDLYAHYDIGMTRTFSDSVRTYRVPEKADLPPAAVNQLAAAIRFIEQGFGSVGRVKMANEDLIELVYGWNDEMHKIRDVTMPCTTEIYKKIFTRPFLSVALVTMRHQEKRARAFWGQVAQDDGLDRADPRKALNKKLWMLASITGTAISNSDVLSPVVQARMAAHAWNKFYRGKNLTVIREAWLAELDVISIEGTPYE